MTEALADIVQRAGVGALYSGLSVSLVKYDEGPYSPLPYFTLTHSPMILDSRYSNQSIQFFLC